MATSEIISDNPLIDADDDDVYGKAVIDFEANETGEVDLKKGKLRNFCHCDLYLLVLA